MSFKSKCLISMSLIASTMIVKADELTGIPDLESIRSSLTAYEKAANLKPLLDGGRDELRVWAVSYMNGRLSGYIIREDGMLHCTAREGYNKHGKFVVSYMSCVRMFSQSKAEAAMKMLDELARLDGQFVSCPVLDGGGVLIDAIRSRHRFIIEANNPGECSAPGTKEVNGVTHVLWK